jgi:indole-3-glycerol phosphate synthase
MEDLKNARTATALPVLLKDFVFDEYQILEAKMVGASAVLLIADMIPASQLKQLAKFAKSVGLDTLVEVFTDASVEAAIKTDSEILGINTRNLRTLEMNPARVEQLISQIPKDRALVAESGVKTVADIARLKKLSVAAVLVGESLLKQNDPMSGVRALVEAGKK